MMEIGSILLGFPSNSKFEASLQDTSVYQTAKHCIMSTLPQKVILLKIHLSSCFHQALDVPPYIAGSTPKASSLSPEVQPTSDKILTTGTNKPMLSISKDQQE